MKRIKIIHFFRYALYKLYQLKAVRLLRGIVSFFVASGDLHSARKKLLSELTLSDDEKTLLAKVSLTVHPYDEMYVPFDARHYLSVGLSAMRCIENALHRASGHNSVRCILDFPCGYGRVLRFLKARFPNADITVSEIDRVALEFCRRTFSVESSVSSIDFSKLSVSGEFDLIWCGSLMTHLDETSTMELLKFFRDHLSPGGVCLFTTQGMHSVELIEKNRNAYRLTANGQRQILSEFHKTGYGYADYGDCHGYGVSVVSKDRMLAIASSIERWNDIWFFERGWDNHQDVYGLWRGSAQESNTCSATEAA